jgi:hypothetical protein
VGKKRIKPNYRRRVLRLPDLDHCKPSVLNSLGNHQTSTLDSGAWSPERTLAHCLFYQSIKSSHQGGYINPLLLECQEVWVLDPNPFGLAHTISNQTSLTSARPDPLWDCASLGGAQLR